MSRQKIIYDCDPGHDDAIALMLAAGSPELAIITISPASSCALKIALSTVCSIPTGNEAFLITCTLPARLIKLGAAPVLINSALLS